jgi:predicted PurR-regulated permease PerM
MSNTKIWAISIMCVICGGALYVMAPSLGPVFWALFLAYIIHPLVLRLQKRLKLKRKLPAVLITLLLIVALLAILINSLLPVIVYQSTVFVREFNSYSLVFFGQMDQLLDNLDSMGLDSRVTEQLDGIFRLHDAQQFCHGSGGVRFRDHFWIHGHYNRFDPACFLPSGRAAAGKVCR